MALRSEDLIVEREARVYHFPTAVARARARRRAALRRRRAGLGLLGLLAIAGTLVATGPAGTAVASRPGSPGSVVLRPGQTLWDLADRYAPVSVDPRAYVDAVIETNALGGAPRAGDRLELPR